MKIVEAQQRRCASSHLARGCVIVRMVTASGHFRKGMSTERRAAAGHQQQWNTEEDDSANQGVAGVERGSTLLSISRDDERRIDLADCEASLRRFFARRVRAQWDVEDLVQESLTRLMVVEQRGPIAQPFGYLFRIAHNLLVDRARRNGVMPVLVAGIEDYEHPAAQPEQEDALHLEDLRHQLEQALDELPVKCREAFILRRFHEMDTPTIAARLDVSHRMVQKYLIRAMEHLHLRLKKKDDVVA